MGPAVSRTSLICTELYLDQRLFMPSYYLSKSYGTTKFHHGQILSGTSFIRPSDLHLDRAISGTIVINTDQVLHRNNFIFSKRVNLKLIFSGPSSAVTSLSTLTKFHLNLHLS